MKFKVTLEIEVARSQGRFVSRDDIAEYLQEEITNADPGSFTVGESDSEYETVAWEVTEVAKG